jgi:protease-4
MNHLLEEREPMGLFTPLGKLRRRLSGDRRVAYIEIEGIIAEQKALSSAPSILEQLDQVREKEIKALVLRVNSPGGTVGASQEIYEKVLRLRERHGVRVVATMGDVAASGGVYVAMAAERVLANSGTVTGSIGVIIKSGNFKRLLDRIGIRSDVVKSGRFKDIMSYERALTDEERALLQETIDDTYAQFVEVVAKGRNLPVETVRSFADGRIFSGRQALALGLVDELGGKALAFDRVRELAGLPTDEPPQVVGLGRKKSMLYRLLENRLSSPGGAYAHALRWLEQSALDNLPLWLMP